MGLWVGDCPETSGAEPFTNLFNVLDPWCPAEGKVNFLFSGIMEGETMLYSVLDSNVKSITFTILYGGNS